MDKFNSEPPTGASILAAATERPDPPAPSLTDAAAEAWFRDHFPGSPVARDTQSWNHLFKALPDLKRRLNRIDRA